jgi:hypothetical protein
MEQNCYKGNGVFHSYQIILWRPKNVLLYILPKIPEAYIVCDTSSPI